MDYKLIDDFKLSYRTSGDKWFRKRWHYVEAIILKAYLDSYISGGSIDEYVFVKQYIDSLYNLNGQIEEINPEYFSIDQIRMASVLLSLYGIEKDPKYKKIMDILYAQLGRYPRTTSGNFWHKENYPDQVWLDGLYMGQPFYSGYMKEFEGETVFADTLRQFENVRKNIFDDSRKLYLHAFDESRKIFWCDKKTGLSPEVWSRAVGWFVMAVVDVLEIIQETAKTDILKNILKEAVDGMLYHQDQSGLWFQVVDKETVPGNYLETSGSAMMAYAILKGVRLQFLPDEYRSSGVSAFEGIFNTQLKESGGEIFLGGICESAGLGKHPSTGVLRDGSFEYYTKGEPVVSNNGHGVAPFLMAYNEMKKMTGSMNSIYDIYI